MPYYFFFWTDDLVEHLAEHDLTPEDFERVVCSPQSVDRSRSSGNHSAFGYTEDGRFIIAVYERLDDMTILPVTAYEVDEPRR
ncbi:MAG: hypothetical protein U0793_24735 [Gemmataceae bacterium]